MRKIWLNGEILPETEARISVYDSACMFGDIAFEMTRSFNGVQFRLKEHINRLMKSCRYLRIPMTISETELEYACYEVMGANEFAPDDEHRLMINVTRGILGIYKEVEGVSQGTNVMITDFPLRLTTAGMGKLFSTGIHCAIPSQRTIPASLLKPKVKNRNRIHYLMGNIEVSRLKQESWALFLDPDGYIAEGAGCNFFIVKNGYPVTPEPRNILRGISRDYIIQRWEALGNGFWNTRKHVCIDNLEVYDVFDADVVYPPGP